MRCEWTDWFLRALGYFILVVLIFNCKSSFVKKCNCLIVYSEIFFGRDLFSRRDQSVGKQWGLIDWFLYGAPYSIEEFFKWIYQNHLLIICVKICNSSNTLQFFHIPPNNVSEILWKKLQFIIFCIFLTLLLFSLWSCFKLVWQNSNQLSLNVISLPCLT